MKRALLVIDVQNEYFPGGALPITHPKDHLANILLAMNEAHKKKVPVVVVQHTFLQPEMPFFQRETPTWRLHSEVADRPRDHFVEKNYPGSFTGTDLESWLRGRDIDTVTVAGYMSHGCCDTTARQAMHLNFNVEFLADATGTLPLKNEAGAVTADEMHRAILVAQQMLFSKVMTTQEWLAKI